MEWKKIRNWLILLVLAVDVFLAGNLLLQVLQAQQTVRQAAVDAVSVARNRGIDLSLETVLDLPQQMQRYHALRSDQLEQEAANALLGGQALKENPGGGVSIYRTATGEMSFRRGGTLEMNGPWTQTTFDVQTCAQTLSLAGFSVETAQVNLQNGAVELMQFFEELPVFNSRVICVQQEDRFQVRGRWMLNESPAVDEVGMSRAQMVLVLCDLLETRQVGEMYRLEAGYYLQSEDAQSLTLEPVWAVETDQGQLIVSCITGEQVNF